MPVFFIVIFSVYFSGNLYVFYRGWQAISGLPIGLKITLAILYWLAMLSFLLLIKRDGSIPATLGHYLHQVGTGWLVFTLYMVICLLVIDFLKLFHLQYAYSFFIAFGLVACVLIYGFIHYKHPKITQLDIHIDKPIDSPDKQLKVVAVSDVHIGYGTDKPALKKYVDLINAQQPDLILIAGDLIDNSIAPLRQQRLDEELSQLKAPLGIYMAAGNHEYISDMQGSIDFLANTPIHLLQDSAVTLPNRLQIIGRDDRSNSRRLPVSELMQKANSEWPSILLDHQPMELEKTAAAGVDLQISGHTHAGQVWPITLVTKRMFELSYGYLKKGNSHFYTSSGLSLWGPPFRICSSSEMVVFNLTFK
ncbi:putative MPP superfamily phosphohydrolase [Parabacteroides sp. PF5-5]|uniref:metallophosphoesterase n=1 Tax=unclassified Parabacteroides TaxID=2649774 RepID=UPI002475B488|nr:MULTISPECIES: metallophosphoesterase [unclassified Parabacteroides]MDH6306238.1 putative MPP superfamily phosphohydrolase [Parabacteroides sp. PH5-39]MDH6316970.1 putative MPP superfamily phosphohydrolase [Parabacteroides sp. PF5-13]MDH6321040.1 putative MPP superfamily phosphohydrolase [Parabacteroides sp. PH5-13]MDH6324772.1 putative MPP superfamily phosphohydrolase [Parabacteroides sp. PH5-8]MDH6328155.1 putative MPP superfamily phosphohydrolase [Parabacteroides sp. PH5-41]